MRRTIFLIFASAAIAAPALAQPAADPDPRIVIREAVRDTIAGTHRAVVRAYQGRNAGPEQTERFSRKVRIGRDGRVTIANIAGDIVVTAGGGDEVSIEAVKRTRGAAGQLQNVRIEVTERGGGVDIRTMHGGRADDTSVDFNVTMPAGGALDVHSVSGEVKVTGVRGAVRAESISGSVTAIDTPRIELAKSVSGDVTLTGVSTDGDLTAGSVSGAVVAKSVKVHALTLSSVSGDVRVTDVTCDRLGAKSVSGGFEYVGAINRGGTYDINLHSGNARLTLANPPGFVLTADSFSGAVRSELAMTIGGDADRDAGRGRRGLMNRHSMRATFGDGSATLNVRTFSGDIIISKR